MPRPRAGDWLDDEIAGWQTEGVDTVVSLLEAEEVAELGLQREAALCRRHDIEFLSFPIRDRDVPESAQAVVALVETIDHQVSAGNSVAIHCRAGIGRSSLVAACVLLSLGLEPGAAFDAIERARGVRVPDTEAQRAWVAAFGDQTIL